MAEVKYRADIDGLRTVAVVPVVFFHAGLLGFSGGYVGVDIFFVISGFLITAILLKLGAEDRFSIADFYRRRIQRILPALLLVVAATTLACWAAFPPEALRDYGSSLGFVSLFASNFWFRKAVDYFASASHVQPLLHTWSLAVEEQFYIFYPILILLVSKSRLKLHWVLLAIGFVSLALAIALLPVAPSSVFYLLPTRAWELIIGGLLSCGFVPPPRTPRLASGAGALGLVCIVLSVVCYTPQTPFPGLAAVPPCLGAALIIWSGTLKSGPVHALLASPPFVLIGKASYSFYLWHFPIFALAVYLTGTPMRPGLGLALSGVSLALALTSLVLIENPVRRSRSFWAWFVPLVGMAAAGAVGFQLARSNGFPERLDARSATYVAASADKRRHHSECMTNTRLAPPHQACVLGHPGAMPRVLLWGDSHAMVVATAMETAARRAGASFRFAASADCPPGLGFGISDDKQPGLTKTMAYRYCRVYNEEMLKLALGDPAISAVVVAARWTNWRVGEPGNAVEEPVDIRLEDAGGMASSPTDNARVWQSGFSKLVAALRAAGKTVFVVGPVPEPPFDVPQRFYVAQFGLSPPAQALNEADFEKRHRKVLAYLRGLERSGAIRGIWPHELLCQNGRCPLEDAGGLLYFDHNHLSVHGARQTADLYGPVFSR